MTYTDADMLAVLDWIRRHPEHHDESIIKLTFSRLEQMYPCPREPALPGPAEPFRPNEDGEDLLHWL